MFTLTLSSYFGSPRESWLHINVVINWQLSKQGIRWPLSPDRIAGSGVDPSRSSIFLKLSADNFLVWSQAHVYFCFKFISNMLCLCQYRPALLRFWFQTDFRRKHSASVFKIQGPVARSLVSANRWLRGIKMYRFPWYLTLVSTDHASSNPGQAEKTFSYHGHVLVTLHVQFLCSDWLKFDRWVHA